MTAILVLLMFSVFLLIDHFMKPAVVKIHMPRGTQITTPGFEMLGALAQDGGTLLSEDAETDEVLAKLRRTKVATVANKN